MHRILPVVLSCYLMAAHHLRSGQPLMVLFWLVVPVLLFIKHPWIARGFQVAMAIATGLWVQFTYNIALLRIAHEEPWQRMALILGGVALFTALSALGFQTGKMKKRYRLGAKVASEPLPESQENSELS